MKVKINLTINLEVDRDQAMELPFEEVPFEILEVLVSYLNTKYFYEQMKEIRPSYNEPYPIPENLSLDVNIIFYLIFRLSRSFYNN